MARQVLILGFLALIATANQAQTLLIQKPLPASNEFKNSSFLGSDKNRVYLLNNEGEISALTINNNQFTKVNRIELGGATISQVYRDDNGKAYLLLRNSRDETNIIECSLDGVTREIFNYQKEALRILTTSGTYMVLQAESGTLMMIDSDYGKMLWKKEFKRKVNDALYSPKAAQVFVAIDKSYSILCIDVKSGLVADSFRTTARSPMVMTLNQPENSLIVYMRAFPSLCMINVTDHEIQSIQPIEKSLFRLHLTRNHLYGIDYQRKYVWRFSTDSIKVHERISLTVHPDDWIHVDSTFYFLDKKEGVLQPVSILSNQGLHQLKAGTEYTWVVGVFSHQPNAQARVTELRKAGYTSFTVLKDGLFRVCVGEFISEEQAYFFKDEHPMLDSAWLFYLNDYAY